MSLAPSKNTEHFAVAPQKPCSCVCSSECLVYSVFLCSPPVCLDCFYVMHKTILGMQVAVKLSILYQRCMKFKEGDYSVTRTALHCARDTAVSRLCLICS